MPGAWYITWDPSFNSILGGKLSQKGGFAGIGLPGNKKMAVGAVYEAGGHLELRCLLHLHYITKSLKFVLSITIPFAL